MAEKNKFIKIQEAIGYFFNNVSLLEQAMTHGSSTAEKENNNERMEFFGDAILDFIVCELLLEQLPQRSEGDLTEIKSEIVSRKSLSTAAKRLDIRDVIILGKGISARHELPTSVYANILEALIAAVYYDSDINTTKDVILPLLIPEIEQAKHSAQKRNYKSLLQEWVQKNSDYTLEYKVVAESGPEHLREFTVEVLVNNQVCGRGVGRSKKAAEQRAAEVALNKL